MTDIKLAQTRNGWAIALRSGKSYRDGATFYEVVRVNRSNVCVTLHRTRDLAKARTLANREWSADKTGSYPAMICSD